MKKLLNFIGSARFALLCALLLILLSIFGSLVSERSYMQLKNSTLISLFFDPNSMEFHNFLHNSGLIDIYSTPFFIIVLAFFALSMLICTIRLVPFAVKGFKPSNSAHLKDKSAFFLSREDFLYLLRKDGFKIKINEDDRTVIQAEVNRVGRFGVILLHIGLLCVLVGACYGNLLGFKSYVRLFEGESLYTLDLETDGKKLDLPFTIKVENFDVDFYDKSRTAKAFNTRLLVTENGLEVGRVNLNVNEPFAYKGIKFYQTDYGRELNKNILFDLTLTNKGEEVSHRFKVGESKKVGDYLVRLADFTPALAFDSESEELLLAENRELVNPAISLELYDSEGVPVIKFWLPQMMEKAASIDELGFSAKFDKIYGLNWTGLSIKKDPGVISVYLGFIYMIFGVLFIYFLNYTAISFKLENDEILYDIRQQRKHSLMSPEKRFLSKVERYSNKDNIKPKTEKKDMHPIVEIFTSIFKFRK